jgi:3'-phosphoadenosine 5'-phosphosulfate sulfotransferase (PAPS reductase)/FAD synthetase
LPDAYREQGRSILASGSSLALRAYRALLERAGVDRSRANVAVELAAGYLATLEAPTRLRKSALRDEVWEVIPGRFARSLRRLMFKGAGHKYIRRVRRNGRWVYYYNVTGGAGLGHVDEMHQGARFKLDQGGKSGHYEVLATEGGWVTIRHDESGHETKIRKTALQTMLHREHAELLEGHRARTRAELEAVGTHGSTKQRERLEAYSRRYMHTADLMDDPELRLMVWPKPVLADSRTTYGARLRPVGSATVPPGYTAIDSHGDFKHGTVTYEAPIEDPKHYGLVEIPSARRRLQVLAAAVADLKEYAAEHVEEAADDPGYFEQVVGHYIDKAGVHMDRAELAADVEAALRGLRPVVPYAEMAKPWETDADILAEHDIHTFAEVAAAGAEKVGQLLGDPARGKRIHGDATMRLGSKDARAMVLADHPSTHPDWVPDLSKVDFFILNSSGGKDSVAMLARAIEVADRQGFPRDRMVVVHADLGRVEWSGTKELAAQQAAMYGVRFEVVRREGQDLLQHIENRYYQLAARIEDTEALSAPPAAVSRVTRVAGLPLAEVATADLVPLGGRGARLVEAAAGRMPPGTRLRTANDHELVFEDESGRRTTLTRMRNTPTWTGEVTRAVHSERLVSGDPSISGTENRRRQNKRREVTTEHKTVAFLQTALRGKRSGSLTDMLAAAVSAVSAQVVAAPTPLTWGDLFARLPEPKKSGRKAEVARFKAEWAAAVAEIAAKLPERNVTYPPGFEDNPKLRQTMSRQMRAEQILASARRKQGQKEPGDPVDWGMPNPWPGDKRYCTSEHKRAVIGVLVTKAAEKMHGLPAWRAERDATRAKRKAIANDRIKVVAKAKGLKGAPRAAEKARITAQLAVSMPDPPEPPAPRILNIMGLRAQESEERAKKPAFYENKASSGVKQIDDWLPVQGWSEEQVWDRIAQEGMPSHDAYLLDPKTGRPTGKGMRRLSCVFCVYADSHDLVVAAVRNPELFAKYLELEERTGFTFQQSNFPKGSPLGLAGKPKSLRAVADAIREHGATESIVREISAALRDIQDARSADLGLVQIGDRRASPHALAKAEGSLGDPSLHTLGSALLHNLRQLRAHGKRPESIQYDYRASGAVVMIDCEGGAYFVGALSYPDAYGGSTAAAAAARFAGIGYEEHGSPDSQGSTSVPARAERARSAR